METCPKIPLISFELKTCDYDDPNDFGDKIQHVTQLYNPKNDL